MKALFWVFLALLLATLYHRTHHFDEAWLAEQAYWLVRDGRVRSELFRGLNDWENGLFIYHKGFIYLSAGWQALFGFSLAAGKSFSLLWTTLGGLALWGFLRQQRLDPYFVWLGMLVYVANGILIEYAFVYRPEAMCVTLGFGSFQLLTNQRRAWAGLLAGLAVLTHLNGLCFVVAGAGWLLWQNGSRALWAVARFGLVAGPVVSLYLLDVWLADGWNTLLMQWRNEPALLHINSLGDKITATFQAIKPVRIAAELGILAVGTYWLTRGLGQRQQTGSRSVGRYLVLLATAHILISRSSAIQYALQFVPFVSAFVALRLAEWNHTYPADRSFWYWRVVLGAYLMAGLYRGSLLIYNNLTIPQVALLNARMASFIGQPGSEIMAPVEFFYEQIGHYKIRCIDRHLGGFFAPLHRGEQLTNEQLFEMAHHKGYAAVITYDGKGPATALTDTRPLPDTLNHIGQYHRVYQDRWNSLYLPDR